MAGQIIVSSIKTDSDNSISFVSNTGATIFSANLASGLSADSFGNNTITSDKIVSVANTKIAGNIVSSQITSVANTQLTGTVTSAQVGSSVYEGMGMRNRIINGDMRIDQRNAGASTNFGQGGEFSTVDRWQSFENTSGSATTQRVVDAPTGFYNSLKVTVTSSATPSSSQVTQLQHMIEGYNTADFAWGTASAKTVTLSFWVKSSITGQFGGSVANEGPTYYSYPFSYTISSANTWEYKTITIAGSTSGTWEATNGTGVRLYFNLGVGSNHLNTPNTWYNALYRGSTGDTSLISTNGATWFLTGVQLEVGSVATPFERRPYGTELNLCQRYFETSYPQGTAVATSLSDTLSVKSVVVVSDSKSWSSFMGFQVKKRTTPTMAFYNRSGTSGQWYFGVSGVSEGSFTVTTSQINESGFSLYASTTGQNVCYGQFTASAEL